jgi:hypothetical protein
MPAGASSIHDYETLDVSRHDVAPIDMLYCFSELPVTGIRSRLLRYERT